MTVKVIGAGLAGAEAAIYLAERGIKVNLYDIKPKKFTPAHKSELFAELVCSNSLKSNDVYGNAAGLLKEEMRILGSAIIDAADRSRVAAGNALAVDREEFSRIITDRVNSNENIEFSSEEITDFDFDGYVVVATGPLTTDALSQKIKERLGGGLFFYDASAPIVAFDGIDMNSAFFGDRYGKGNGDHINCPMNKEEYESFIDALTTAKRAELHDFEKPSVFEGCMPIEIMAARGRDTLRFGPLKPVGLDDPKTGRWPYACLQLRREDKEGTMYNLVGFQTNLTWGEQKRVFGIVPALKNVEFLRYGVMHRNTFINSPENLNDDYSLKDNGKIFFVGQMTGVEGYVESAASGLLAAIYLERKIKGKTEIKISQNTVIGALASYVSTKHENFQPMNANFGLLPCDFVTRDKKLKKQKVAERAVELAKAFKKEIEL